MRHLGSPLDVVKHEVVSTVLAGDGDALHAHLSGAAIQIAAADYIFYLYRDRLAPAGRAQKFPPAISFNPSMSSAWPATIRFKRGFSRT